MGIDGIFVGSEALAGGELTAHELRTYFRRLHPDVYAPKRMQLSLQQRTEAAWLWSRREGVVSGIAASALHGAEFVGDEVPIEVNWPNHRAPKGVLTRNDTLLAAETELIAGIPVTTRERTAFDLARHFVLGQAVARLDSLARATDFKAGEVLALVPQHPHLKGTRGVDRVLNLIDAGAQSPKETWLRLLLIDAGFPRPQTQIPVLSPSGYPRYYLDMGWPEIKVAVEYDGDHHRKDPEQFRKDIIRLEYIQSLGWRLVRVIAGDRRHQIVQRVNRLWTR